MKVKIKVSSSLSFPAEKFEMIKEEDGLELEVEVADEKELDKTIEKWQKYINKKVIKAAFLAGERYLEEKENL